MKLLLILLLTSSLGFSAVRISNSGTTYSQTLQENGMDSSMHSDAEAAQKAPKGMTKEEEESDVLQSIFIVLPVLFFFEMILLTCLQGCFMYFLINMASWGILSPKLFIGFKQKTCTAPLSFFIVKLPYYWWFYTTPLFCISILGGESPFSVRTIYILVLGFVAGFILAKRAQHLSRGIAFRIYFWCEKLLESNLRGKIDQTENDAKQYSEYDRSER